MSDRADLKQIYEREVRAMTLRPSIAQVKGQATARIVDGGACDIECGGDFRLRTDNPTGKGGTGTGPTPGQMVRAGLGACLAMGYDMWARRLGVPIDSIEVDITCELDARGQLGIGDVPAGWQRISWHVRITSDAPEAEVMELIERADRLSPMMGSIDPATERVRTVDIARRTA